MAEPTTEIRTGVALSTLTNLRLGGPARELVVARSEAELMSAVAEADAAAVPVLVLGGGSNVVIGDQGFDGRVVLSAHEEIAELDASSCGGATVKVGAGTPWQALVDAALARGWVGLESLTGIPGSVGATPIQNVGAYGAEVSQTIASVRTWDRRDRAWRTFANADCGFGYRTSRFKREPDRHLITSVTFQFVHGDRSLPIRYAELARALGVEVGERTSTIQVAHAVRGLRAGKAMVVDADDHDTWSAGSFFTNPVLGPEQAARLPDDAPRYDQPDGSVKSSAAWLIEHAGFGKGYGDGPVSLSTRHTLALTNRGGASTADLLGLAGEIRDGVAARFGVVLEPEPVLVGCALPTPPA